MITTIIRKKDFGLYSHLVIEAKQIARHAKPGQFVEVKIKGDQAPFWRRPFCICRAEDNKIELLIKEVGTGSGLMRQLQPGAQVDILGPLGNAFTINQRAEALLIGGGFGVAPLLFLAEQLKAREQAVTVLIGGRCQDDLLLIKQFKRIGAKVLCSTDDGSYGTKGLVTTLLNQQLSKVKEPLQLYTAGPWAMMAAVAKRAQEEGLKCQASLEEVMACGLGVCNGCVVKINDEYKRVCKDGPIFNAEEVKWNK